MPLPANVRLVASADARWKTLDGEIVMLDLASGEYLGLSASAAIAWNMIASPEGATIEAIHARLSEMFDAPLPQIVRDVDSFIEQLEHRAFIVRGA